MKGFIAAAVVLVLLIMGGCSATFIALGGRQDPSRACAPGPDIASPQAQVVQVANAQGGVPAQVGAYKDEQVVVAGQIIAAGRDRSLDLRTITIAVMTGMGESSLTNVAHGDAVRSNTIGVFQEGPERGPYATRMDPYGAAGIFYDHLARVPGYAALPPTIAAHAAQANADPWYYVPFWGDAVQMVSTLTGVQDLSAVLPVSGAVPCTVAADDPGAGGPLPPPNTAAAATAIAYARARLGFPYLWGGTGPNGYDCSGLVLMAYRSAGINLSRVSEQQIGDGVAVPRDQIQPGDLVFFDPGPAGPGHVGIALGNGQMIDAPHTGAFVRIESIDGFGNYVGARRVTGG